MRLLIVVALIAFVFSVQPAQAQSFEAGGHVASSKWSEFDGTDLGVGGRLTWKPIAVIGIDADLTWYPREFEPDGTPFSRNRLEGLFGVTVGPKVQRIRPFVKAAAGFLDVGATSGAFACIAIFPPPIACQLAGGDTLPVYEIGGGAEIDATARSFIRVDVTDRILKYPGPTFDSNFEIRNEGYFGHALRFTIGAGFRF
jgi:hypothetical protein